MVRTTHDEQRALEFEGYLPNTMLVEIPCKRTISLVKATAAYAAINWETREEICAFFDNMSTTTMIVVLLEDGGRWVIKFIELEC